MAPTKVFVGNLAFKTGESELAEAFSVAGKVVSANIITRGPRSLGYGFVELDSEETAKKAVELLNKKEVDGRPINVEVAKVREEGAAPAERPPRGPRAPRPAASGAAPGTSGEPRAPRTRAPRGGAAAGAGRGGARPRRRAPREEGAEESSPQTGEHAAPRRPRAPRPVQDQADRKPSTTTLFVANLPFSLTDAEFAKVLQDNKLTFKSAHVVVKKNARSKGFGFVEFDQEKDQQAALAALNGKQVDGRDLIVKIALTEGPNGGRPVEGKAEEGKEGKQEKKEEAKPAAAPKK